MSIITTEDATPSRERAVLSKPITPASFAAEIEAVRRGYSRNIHRERSGWGGQKDWLELWPRDTPTGGTPFLIDVDRPPAHTRQAAWLAQFTFSYDPARYEPAPPVRLRGLARLRAFRASLRTTHVPAVPFRSCFAGRRPQTWQTADEPEEGDEEAA